MEALQYSTGTLLGVGVVVPRPCPNPSFWKPQKPDQNLRSLSSQPLFTCLQDSTSNNEASGTL